MRIILAILVACSLTRAVAQQRNRAEFLAGELEKLNARILSPEPNPNILRTTLNQRRSLLAELIQADPAKALRLALPKAFADGLRKSAPEGTFESEAVWRGIAAVTVLDDFENRTSRTSIRISAGGRSMAVHPGGASPGIKCGDVIEARGIALGSEMAAREISLVEVGAASSCSSLGQQNIAVILLNMPAASLPANVTAAFVNQLFFGSGGHSLNTYWQEVSYGKTSASGAVFGPFMLAQNITCDQSDAIEAAAIAAADSSVDFRVYNRIFIVTPNYGTCSTGLGTIGCQPLTSPSHGSFTGSVSWMRADYLTGFDAGIQIAGHEGGHNLGLNHASTLQFAGQPLGAPGNPGTHDEYGDYFATMGLAFTFNGFPVVGHYDAPHKTTLGWFAPGNMQLVQAAGTFQLQPYETTTSGLQALRVQRGSGIGQYLWIEYRQPVGFDATFQNYTSQPYSGAFIHFEDPSNLAYQGYTHLLDFTPVTTPGDFSDAALAAGLSWTDPYTTLSLHVNSATPSGLNVTVNYDAPCAGINPTTVNYAVGAQTGSIAVSGSCASTAISNASWITITGGSSLSGSGTVTYSVAANNTPNSRTGTISVARQTFTITQASANPPPAAVSVSPASGAGPLQQFQTFQFTYSDAAGAGVLKDVFALFSPTGATASACWIEYNSADQMLRLYNDDGLGWSSFSIGFGSLSNSQCTVNSAGSSVQSSGNVLTLIVSVSFFPGFKGPVNIYGQAQDNVGGDSGQVLLGSRSLGSGPVLGITKTHSGNFGQGQAGAAYMIVVSNSGTASTSGTVTVTEAPPASLTLTSMTGSGWSCSAGTCTRGDALAAGSSYPPIAAAVNVASNAPAQATNSVSVTGGGSAAANASDPATIVVAAPPFGSIDTPANNSTGIAGAIGFTGWTLSNAGIQTAALWREPVGGEPVAANGMVFLGNTAFVPGARPDVAQTYPGYPGNTSGWGAQILTNELPGNGNGTYRIHVIATNNAGQTTDLGVRTITADNAHGALPFGTIDTPSTGGVASGAAFVNFGWAVTPNPANVIPKDGSTIAVFIDNQSVGHPVYNQFRQDIATLFPGLQNSNGAVGFFMIDTTKLANGLHQIAWSVTDSAGNAQGLGSRFFLVQN